MPDSSIAIIGASITGLSLAISLLQNSLCSVADLNIYDQRSQDIPDAANSSGIVLTPNGLSILDSMGVLERIHDVCWLSEFRTFKNDRDETLRKSIIANESLYGYKNHRLWRRVFLAALLSVVKELGVSIHWKSKFERVTSESKGGVRFLVNGIEKQVGMLIGADGVFSTVRKSLDPHVGPEYTGVVGVLSHIPWNDVQWPYENYERACTIQGKPGALVLMPEDRDGTVIMVAKQVQMEGKSREEWEKLSKDKDWLFSFHQQGYEQWGSTGKKIIDAISKNTETLYMWPYLRMAKLTRWYSESGRVIIMGDAAHALPPSSGQGVNQTLEDIYALTKLLKTDVELTKALEFWQNMRQARIDAVFDYATNATNVQRLPQADREKLVREGKAKDANKTEGFDDMSWLYKHDIDEQIRNWLKTFQ